MVVNFNPLTFFGPILFHASFLKIIIRVITYRPLQINLVHRTSLQHMTTGLDFRTQNG